MSSNRGKRYDTTNSSQADCQTHQAQDGNNAILERLEIMIDGSVAKLNQIFSQNIEMKSAISSINTEITSLKSSLQFMDGTVDKLKEDVCQRVELGVFEAFKRSCG